MSWISSLSQQSDPSPQLLGGKGASLVRLQQAGVLVPRTLCVTTAAYTAFIAGNGLKEKIQLELNKKPFTEMRWEEIWDIALRIRHLFLTSPMEQDLADRLWQGIADTFGDQPLAIRSSAPEEDQQQNSFAGLHDSLLNVSGRSQLLQAIRRVWSSLWSDRALLYRQELQLAPRSSTMAVVIQELTAGKAAGVAFTVSPLTPDEMVIEAVHGLNQGLVDGDIEPDRWRIDRSSGQVIDHQPPKNRKHQMIAATTGVSLAELPENKATQAPLTDSQLQTLVATALQLERVFAHPLDLEWTWHRDQLIILQARPITARAGGSDGDKRAWYLSLHRSFGNLLTLRVKIEQEMLPQMAREAEEMASQDVAVMADLALAETIHHRLARAGHWSKTYWDDCIPFAHGIRLFGEVYNDLISPADPYEFVQLLAGETMLSTDRNRLLARLAAKVRDNGELAVLLRSGRRSDIDDLDFRQDISELENRFANSFGHGRQADMLLAALLAEYGRLPTAPHHLDQDNREQLEQRFLALAEQGDLAMDPKELLALARTSYRLRDDDNIYLGAIEHQLQLAVEEGRQRLAARSPEQALTLATPEEIGRLLTGESVTIVGPSAPASQAQPAESSPVRARQLPGQPASRGIARGIARVITNQESMQHFRAGEILVVDAIDPNMTFLAPLATAIVERRGGMLIHGAIIAREYGIPCVTGVSGATDFIASGDTLTVDGYLGLVTIDKTTRLRSSNPKS